MVPLGVPSQAGQAELPGVELANAVVLEGERSRKIRLYSLVRAWSWSFLRPLKAGMMFGPEYLIEPLTTLGAPRRSHRTLLYDC